MLFGIKYNSFATRSHICYLVVILATILEICIRNYISYYVETRMPYKLI